MSLCVIQQIVKKKYLLVRRYFSFQQKDEKMKISICSENISYVPNYLLFKITIFFSNLLQENTCLQRYVLEKMAHPLLESLCTSRGISASFLRYRNGNIYFFNTQTNVYYYDKSTNKFTIYRPSHFVQFLQLQPPTYWRLQLQKSTPPTKKNKHFAAFVIGVSSYRCE